MLMLEPLFYCINSRIGNSIYCYGADDWHYGFDT